MTAVRETTIGAHELASALVAQGFAVKIVEHGFAVNVWTAGEILGAPSAQVWLPVEGFDSYTWGDKWQHTAPTSAGMPAAVYAIAKSIR